MSKKLRTLVLLITLAGGNLFAQVNLQLGLIAYYPMNNSPLDSTSNHLDLTPYGNPQGAMDRFGYLPGAYSFDASNPDYFTAALNPLLAPTEVTLSAWVNFTDASIDQKVAGRATVNGGGYLMGVDSSKIDAEIWDIAGIHYRLKAKTVDSNLWVHLVMSYKANEYLRVYIDGIEADSIPAGSSGIGTSTGWTFTVGGAPWQPTALNPTGSIDDIYVYSRAINNAEVIALYGFSTNTLNGIPSYSLNSIYPVPVHDGNLNVEFNNRVEGTVSINITDNFGKNVFTTEFVNPKKEALDIGRLPGGIYSISFMNGNKVETHKIVIQ